MTSPIADLPDPWPAPTVTEPVNVTVSLPGSKSLTNRALVLAALADGPSVVRRALRSRDTLLMAQALSSLGATVDTVGPDWAVTPLDGSVPGDRAVVDCGLAGTVMRFVPPVAGLVRGEVAFDGDPHMRNRPIGEVLSALAALGLSIDDTAVGASGALPFTISGTGHVPGGTVVIDASASSQFVSALLLAGARFDAGVDVRHDGKPIPSLPHIEMTIAMLRDRGVNVDDADANRWAVAPGPIAAHDETIEPDLSNAAPFLALAAISGGSVTVRDWPASTTQAGDALRGLLTQMGCTVERGTEGLRVTGPEGGHRALRGLEADLHDVGELAPAVAALCALASTPSHLTGIAHIRGHETDRLAALAKELGGLGADVVEHPDGLTLRPAPLTGGVFHTYADHRMAHAGVIIGAAVPGVLVENVATTSKTFPDFRRILVRVVLMERYTDHDVEHYDRPRRRTRPRTKDRPSHDDAVDGVVVTVDRGRFTLLVGDHVVTAMKARPLGRKGVVTGDRVRVVGDVSGADGSLARIVEVTPRTTVLRRTADDDDPVERVLVSNATQLVVVTALTDPEPRPRLIDRALVAAYDAGLAPLLCLTKSDLADPEVLLSTYRSLGVPWVVTQRHADRSILGLEEVKEQLAGQVSVLVGHSGVGKSTLVNALVPDAKRKIGHVNAVTGRGRHTSTSAVLLPLPAEWGEGGWIIDTPGIRSFGLAHVQPENLIEAFPDLDEMTEGCPRGCTHGEDEPECGLDEAIAAGEADPERVTSFRRLLAARSVTEY